MFIRIIRMTRMNLQSIPPNSHLRRDTPNATGQTSYILAHFLVSSQHEWNLEELMEEIWSRCNMMRIYTKPKGQVPDYDEPVILHCEGNPSVEEFCNRIHRTLINQFSHAWVWGRSAKHQPQRCGKDHCLMDEDVVQLVKKAG